MTIFDKDKIVDNFLHMEKSYPTRNLSKSPTPTLLPVDLKHQLPEQFETKGNHLSVQGFLNRTQTTGMLIIHKGTIVLEDYYRGMTPSSSHISWSIAKSFISGLVGIALHEGHFDSIEDPITKYLPQLKNSGYNGVRIKDILQMSSGVRFYEDYGDFYSDINRFGRYFALGRSFEHFTLSLKNERPPGTFHHYVSIDTQVLGMLITKTTGQSLTTYLKEKIWDPVGMEHDAQWIIDNKGMEMALGGLNASLRDYAKFGLLYLRGGNWMGQQVIPEEWVRQSVTPDAPHVQPGWHDHSEHPSGYGYQWWIPMNPDGAYFASGIYNQHIYVQPNRDLVIVKTSGNYHYKKNRDFEVSQHVDFFKAVVQQFPKI